MKIIVYWIYCIISVALIFVTGQGCAPRYEGYGPHFQPLEKNIRIAILKPKLYCYDVSGGGVNEYRDDWSMTGTNVLAETIKKQLDDSHLEAEIIKEFPGNFDPDTLFSYVNLNAGAIRYHLYGKNPFIAQIDSFNYSIGQIRDICNLLNADAILFVNAFDEHFSDVHREMLRKSAAVKTARSIIGSVIMTILFGSSSYRIYDVPKERTIVNCTVADANGRIIWYNQYMKADDADLTRYSDNERITKEILKGFFNRNTK
jgi:hypothetical protein